MNPGLTPEARTNTDLKQDTWELFILQIFFLFLCSRKSNISTTPERTETVDRVNSLTHSALKRCPNAGTQVHVLACQMIGVIYMNCEAAADLVFSVDTRLYVFKTLLEA